MDSSIEGNSSFLPILTPIHLIDSDKTMKKHDKEIGEIYVLSVSNHEIHPSITGGEVAAEQERNMRLEEEKLRKAALDEKPPVEAPEEADDL